MARARYRPSTDAACSTSASVHSSRWNSAVPTTSTTTTTATRTPTPANRWRRPNWPVGASRRSRSFTSGSGHARLAAYGHYEAEADDGRGVASHGAARGWDRQDAGLAAVVGDARGQPHRGLAELQRARALPELAAPGDRLDVAVPLQGESRHAEHHRLADALPRRVVAGPLGQGGDLAGAVAGVLLRVDAVGLAGPRREAVVAGQLAVDLGRHAVGATVLA